MARRVVIAVTLLSAAIAVTLVAGALVGSSGSSVAGAAGTTRPQISRSTRPARSTVPPTAAATVPPTAPTVPATAPPTVPRRAPTRATTPAYAPSRVPTTAPSYSYPQVTGGTTVTAPPATAAPTTTLEGIGGRIPVAPSTLPLATRGSNAHVSGIFALLSGIGFGLALLIVAGRLLVTRSGGRDRRPMSGPAH